MLHLKPKHDPKHFERSIMNTGMLIVRGTISREQNTSRLEAGTTIMLILSSIWKRVGDGMLIIVNGIRLL